MSKFRKEKESCYLVIPSSTKLEIKHFHVVVVQWRLKNVQKSVMHVQSCCFVNLNLLLCSCSCCRCLRRRCCLSSLMTNKCTKMRDARAKSLSLFATQATAWQQCCDIVSNSYNIVLTLQRCVALKIVVANRNIVSNSYNIDPTLERCVELKIVVANRPV